jgi:hypothetical protein
MNRQNRIIQAIDVQPMTRAQIIALIRKQQLDQFRKGK